MSDFYFDGRTWNTYSRIAIAMVTGWLSGQLLNIAKHKYDPEYVKYEFMYIEEKKVPNPKCVACSEC